MLAANNVTVLEPNILYLEEKTPRIVKTKKTVTSKRSTKKAPSIRKPKPNIPLTGRKRSTKVNKNNTIKTELCTYGKQPEKIVDHDLNDPLYTAKLEIKYELDENNHNNSIEYDCKTVELGDDDNADDDDDDDDHDYNYELERIKSKLERRSDDDDELDENKYEAEEDEPLIMLSQHKYRSRKKLPELGNKKLKAPRSVACQEKCKQHCSEKFSEEQRIKICNYYWNLSNKEDRLAFIRKHIRTRRSTRMKRVKAHRSRANNVCYYLKPYKRGSEEETTPENSSDLIRVCRKFFEATLNTTDHFIKKANVGNVLEIEKDVHLFSQLKLATKKESCQEAQQILDPATGNLITLDAKAYKTPKSKVQTTSQDKNEQKKRMRRKPGDPLPEHFPKPIKCAVRCIYKCHTKFSEEERKQICDFFWSMDYKRRKDFILANIELKDIETQTTPDYRITNRPPRSYQTRFFMRSGGMRGEKLRVCKDFYEKTLSINRYFIENAIKFADKTTGYYTGTDRRGAHIAHNKKSEACKQTVLDHIESYPFWIPNKKTKTRYLHHSLNIRKMYEAYKDKCLAEKLDYVSNQYYNNAFHDNFNMLFLANPQPKKGWGLQKANPNVSHYTGEEPGGCWINSKGKKLNLRSINPAQSLNICQHNSTAEVSKNAESASGVAHELNVDNPSSFMSLNSTIDDPSALVAVVRSDLNPAIYGHLSHDPMNMFKML